MEVPISCPRIALQSETQMIDMELRIWRLKCLLLTRIKKLKEGALEKFDKKKIHCNFCPTDFTQEHMLKCHRRCEHRKDLYMDNLEDQVTYFKRVIDEE